MRTCSLAAVLLVGCGSGSELVGTWRFSFETMVQGPSGPVAQQVSFDLDLGASPASDLIVWRLGGGCNVALPVAGKIAELVTAPPLCGMTAGTSLPLLAERGITVKAEDQLEVKAARFELRSDDRLATTFDYKLYTDLRDAKVGPVVSVTAADGRQGTRVK